MKGFVGYFANVLSSNNIIPTDTRTTFEKPYQLWKVLKLYKGRSGLFPRKYLSLVEEYPTDNILFFFFFASGYDLDPAQRGDGRGGGRGPGAADLGASGPVQGSLRGHPAPQVSPLLPAQDRQADRREIQDHHQG